MEDEDDILNEFLVECSEGIEQLDQEFVELEKNTDDPNLLGSIFRNIHTIKGTCGFLGLPKLENVAHGAENILSAMRDGDMAVTSDGITILLEAVDAIKEIVHHIEETGSEPDKSYDAMRQSLDVFLSGAATESKGDTTTESEAVALEAMMEGLDIEEIPEKDSHETETIAPEPSAVIESLEEEFLNAPAFNTSPEPVAEPVSPDPDNEKVDAPVSAASDKKKPALAESSIRVDVGLLDKLINMVGELVLARNQLLQQVRSREDDASNSTNNGTVNSTNNGTVQQIDHITTELQDTVMKTRMQPIKKIWDKFPRVVRDLAKSSGKEIDLVMEGAETELDKTLLEAIKDPMTHIIRNAIDHGIELPESRKERGKPEKGTLFLKAYHEGGRINIEISDDGGGIDVERVKTKALSKGLITEEIAEKMSQVDALNLIFHPGLSTAEKVTNVSGRGVGMDVVKTNIEKIGGTVRMSSRLGKGTQMNVEIPLTVAIIPALMVSSGGAPFAIPQASLIELVRLDNESLQHIEMVRGSNFYRLRGVLLPILSINTLLGLEDEILEDEDIHSKGTNIMVLKAGRNSFGLIVDLISDTEEIVVKPLNKQLSGLSYLAGATILGDGRVALILDVMGIAEAGGLSGAAHENLGMRSEDDIWHESDTTIVSMVLFSVSSEDRYAVPLAEIARLEEFDVTKIEQASGQDVIQYRDELLTLVRLGDAIGVVTAETENDRIPVIVFTRNEHSIGVVVGKIIDIVTSEMHLHLSPMKKTGIKGSLVIDGISTELLDIDQFIDTVVPGWMDEVTV